MLNTRRARYPAAVIGRHVTNHGLEERTLFEGRIPPDLLLSVSPHVPHYARRERALPAPNRRRHAPLLFQATVRGSAGCLFPRGRAPDLRPIATLPSAHRQQARDGKGIRGMLSLVNSHLSLGVRHGSLLVCPLPRHSSRSSRQPAAGKPRVRRRRRSFRIPHWRLFEFEQLFPPPSET